MRLFPALRACTVLILATGIAAQAQSYTETVLHNFEYTDGAFPTQNIIQAHDGNFYGTTYTGGANEYGVAFKITPSGTLTALHSFVDETDGDGPNGLVEGPDGNLYGTCVSGGTSQNGNVFKMTPAGAVTVLYNFSGAADGTAPSVLVLGNDGNLWGTTGGDTSTGVGTIFKVTLGGALTTVYTFPADGSKGYNPPNIQLLQASDGNFYGTALQTPPNEIILLKPHPGAAKSHGSRPLDEPSASNTDGGIIFSISPKGSFSEPYLFGTNDGDDPNVALVEGNNGKLYGETFYGTQYYGSIFTYELSNAGFSTVYTFTQNDQGGPEGGLFLASDGNFYGTASSAADYGALYGGGTVFKLTPANVFSTLYKFGGSGNGEGGNPDSGVTQGADGALYGTTNTQGYFGGSECSQDGCGDVYKIVASPAMAAPVQLSFSSTTTAPDTAVTLNWKVLNAFSDTYQLCYAYQSGANGATGYGTTWTGKQTGILSSSTHLYTGSAQITPTADGTYTYALTCGGQESGSVVLTVSGKGKSASTTTLKDSPTAPVIGQSLTFTATVGGGTDPAPTGTVTFYYSTFALGTGTLSSGSASLTLSTTGLPAGTYPITASYSGDTNYESSASTALNVVVSKSATTTALVITPTTVTQPGSVKFTGTVKRSTAGIAGSPTGSIAFSTGTYTIATVNLSAGSASYSLTLDGLPSGTYPITATYSGDDGDNASSATGSVTVK